MKSRGSLVCGTWLIHMCDMTHSYVCHDSFICVPWLIHSFICATWLVHMRDVTHSYMCAMTRSYVCHDSFVYVPWLIHMCDMTHSYVWHDSFICGTWLIHMCAMTHSYVWHDSFICVPWLIHSFICATWLVHMRDVTHSYMCDMTRSYAWRDSFVCATWLVDMRDVNHSYMCNIYVQLSRARSQQTRSYVWHEPSTYIGVVSQVLRATHTPTHTNTHTHTPTHTGSRVSRLKSLTPYSTDISFSHPIPQIYVSHTLFHRYIFLTPYSTDTCFSLPIPQIYVSDSLYIYTYIHTCARRRARDMWHDSSICASHVTHVDREPKHTEHTNQSDSQYVWHVTHIASHVAHIDESWASHVILTSRVRVVCESCRQYVSSILSIDSRECFCSLSICVTWLATCDTTSHVTYVRVTSHMLIENKNTQNTQINLNKRKLGEP